MTETDYQTIWNNYVIQPPKFWGHFEVKATTQKTFNLKKIRDNQLFGLENMEDNGWCWKHSDTDPRQKPCDSSNIPPLECYVVIVFSGVFYAIRIKEILEHIKTVSWSIKEEKARELATKIVRF